MDTVNTRTTLALVALAAGSLLLAGCATPSAAPPEDSAAPGATETDTRQARLLIPDAETGTVLVVDGGTLETLAALQLDGAGAIYPYGDTRYALSVQTDGDRVQVIDSGTWSEDHGEHAHHYVADPAVVEGTLEGPTPVHVTVFDGLAGVYTDGDGALHVIDGGTLGDGLTATTVESGDPHHGVGYALGDGAAILSFSNAEGRATGVRVIDAGGTVLAESDACVGLHGETELRRGIVFACADGLLALTDTHGWVFEKVPYGVAGRTGSLVTNDDAEVAYGILDGTTLLTWDGTAIATASLPGIGIALDVAPNGDAVVALADGTVVRVTPAGEVLSTRMLIGAFDPDSDHSAPRPAITVGDGVIFVSDPAGDRVVALDPATLDLVGTIDLGFTPKGVALLG